MVDRKPSSVLTCVHPDCKQKANQAVKDVDPQLFAPDSAFWQDMSTYVCSSPQSNYEFAPEDPSASPDTFSPPPRSNLRRVRSKDQSPEVILVCSVQQSASYHSVPPPKTGEQC